MLNLQSIPDVNFIEGQVFHDIKLNEFVIDRESHADSVLEWSVEVIGIENNIIIQVSPDATIFATASGTGSTVVVFTVRDLALDVVGRDTVKVTVLDRGLVSEPLQDFGPVTFKAGQSVTSVDLNDHLPSAILDKVGPNPSVKWSVSGQQISLPIIDPQPPHRLTLQSVGERVGIDTLFFRAELSGGFNATGLMVVTVSEPVDSTTVDILAIPNPFNPTKYIDVFIVSRRAVETSPTLLRIVDLTTFPFRGVDS